MTRQDWLAEGERRGWKPLSPSAAWKRLPVVRHLRFTRHLFLCSLWDAAGPGSTGIPTGYDNWALEGMLRGYW